MTPKKAIVIVLIMFLAAAFIFVFLYIKSITGGPIDKLDRSSQNNSANSTGQEKLSPLQQKIKAIETKTNQQIEKIVEQGKTSTGGVTAEAQRQVDAAVNQEIMEKTKLKTPEQIKADEQRRAEQEKIDQQVNQQIRNQLKNK